MVFKLFKSRTQKMNKISSWMKLIWRFIWLLRQQWWVRHLWWWGHNLWWCLLLWWCSHLRWWCNLQWWCNLKWWCKVPPVKWWLSQWVHRTWVGCNLKICLCSQLQGSKWCMELQDSLWCNNLFLEWWCNNLVILLNKWWWPLEWCNSSNPQCRSNRILIHKSSTFFE